jgi:HPt (histidine-containing phosphotransfer) domain-containing protein
MEISRDTVLEALANGIQGNGNRPNLDRRAMDALVNAVEARLREHSAQMDRRLADLEAGLAIEMDSLRQQEHSIAARAENALEQANKQWNEQTLSLWQQRKEDMSALRQEFTDFQRQFITEITTAVEREVRCQIDIAVGNLRKLVENMAAERLDPLAAELEIRNREMVNIRQRLVENERNVLEFALGMGEWFRELAARMCSPRPSELPPPAIPAPSVSGT